MTGMRGCRMGEDEEAFTSRRSSAARSQLGLAGGHRLLQPSWSPGGVSQMETEPETPPVDTFTFTEVSYASLCISRCRVTLTALSQVAAPFVSDCSNMSSTAHRPLTWKTLSRSRQRVPKKQAKSPDRREDHNSHQIGTWTEKVASSQRLRLGPPSLNQLQDRAGSRTVDRAAMN
eukprot:2629532-Rhodomonas_salina.2